MGKLWIGCIADDFTGGSDAASFLQKAGLRTILLNGDYLEERIMAHEPDAVVIALKSRSIPAPEAVAQVTKAAKWLLAHGAKQLYFKYCSTFDSTPGGNIGPVTDALMELLDVPFTVLCPSLPINGRTVENGDLYVNGILLEHSSMRNHPINPMTKSSLPVLMMEQSRYPCIALTRAEMAEHPAAFNVPAEHFTLVPPYATDQDGARIAEVFGDMPLLTGGSGLLQHLGARLGLSGQAALSCAEAAPRLLLAGSCSVMTQKQVQRYLEKGGSAVRIDPEALLSGGQTEKGLCTKMASAERDLLFYSTAPAEQVRRNQRRGTQAVSELLESLMGRLAVCGRKQGYRRIVVAGGETSSAVVRALHAEACWIGESIAPGVPELWPVEQPEIRLVLKSGNFGNEDFFLKALLPEA